MKRQVYIASLSVGLWLGSLSSGQDAPATATDAYKAPSPANVDAATQPTLSKEQLAQLVAPLALYPDSLLTQILMASTYPLEVVQADRFVKANPNLKGDDLARQLEQQPWDPSVKSLVNFPQVLSMMSEKLDTTVQIGNAFLAQQQDVLAAVQDLRGKAEQAGTLKSNEQINVTSQPADTADNGGVDYSGISIASTADNLTYVPNYDASTVYGTWPYPSYQPYSYNPYGYGNSGLVWGSGIVYGAPWGYAWGDCDWRHRWVRYDDRRGERWNHVIDRDHYRERWDRYRQARQLREDRWAHDGRHRDGVPYPDARDAEIYRQRSRDADRHARDGFRGREVQASGNNVDRQETRNDSRITINNDREVTINRSRGNDSTPDRIGVGSDGRRDDDRNRSEVIRRDQQTTADRQRGEAEQRSSRRNDAQSADRDSIGDVSRSPSQERAAAERGRASRSPSAGSRVDSPAATPARPTPVRPTPGRSSPSPSPSPRVNSPAQRPSGPSASPSRTGGASRSPAPSGGSSGGGRRSK